MNFEMVDFKSGVDIIKALAVIGAGGGGMSLLTSALVGSNWPRPAKSLTALLMCVIGAFLTVLISGIDMTNYVVVLPTMWLACYAFYVVWFKPAGIAPWIETLFRPIK